MTSAVGLYEPVVNDERGFPLLSVRLIEPIETIIANNPELKVEQTADGETVFMSPTGGESGLRNSDINADLVNWARSYGGIVFDSSTLFRLPNGALRSPDASWIQAARWQCLSDQERKSFPPIAPDFMIELRSQTDRVIDLQDKMKEYASCGVRLGWLIDPLQKQVYIYRSIETPVVLSEPNSVSDEAVLPGFVLDLSLIFA